jgi:hypothetical protein
MNKIKESEPKLTEINTKKIREYITKSKASGGMSKFWFRGRLLQACDEIDRLTAELEAKDEALHKISNWTKAYPLEVFPKPDLKKAAEVLKDAGMTLDAISADNMRHVLDGIKDIIEQVMKGKADEIENKAKGDKPMEGRSDKAEGNINQNGRVSCRAIR